ncbi:MAG: MarR family transcriptional regulator [Anaeroplasmataceae bacterium]|nr:MarR family transcriptional regulator [Anaeroplasmataceae bacterium]
MRKLNETEICLLKLIHEHPEISLDKLSEAAYLCRSSVAKYLKQLREEKLLSDNGEKSPKYRRILTNEALDLLTKL